MATRGRPLKDINEDQVLALKTIGFKWKEIADLIGVSDRTLRTRRKEFTQHNIEIKTKTVVFSPHFGLSVPPFPYKACCSFHPASMVPPSHHARVMHANFKMSEARRANLVS
uniref:Uncharacterized protein n=1 Tax=Clytia hemisphaerica TaxID=252671 RepID=A0A7M6DPG8_9CNID